jgi:hypothetical protein
MENTVIAHYYVTQLMLNICCWQLLKYFFLLVYTEFIYNTYT